MKVKVYEIINGRSDLIIRDKDDLYDEIESHLECNEGDFIEIRSVVMDERDLKLLTVKESQEDRYMDAKESSLKEYISKLGLNPEMQKRLCALIEKRALSMCIEQRKICFDAWKNMPEWDNDSRSEIIERAERDILNAPLATGR